ncbi:MAG: N-acetylneuraminate synthase [Syntrophorhabdaceae bacterium]|nr:N-acetylneuraminate synthase [Syntrophorhabdaceae bacterium]
MAAQKRTYIIAEAGVNHNGNIDIAKRMIDAAARAGADAVKFQTFVPEEIACGNAPKAEYQKRTTGDKGSQFDMLRRLALDADGHRKLLGYCSRKGIDFLSSPFDMQSIDLLNDLGLAMFKIPSGEITNLPYLQKIGGMKKKIIMSTGMADMKEIDRALKVLIKAGTAKNNITLLHCNTEYPTPFEDVNLLAMTAMKKRFGVKVGYSDHTPGIEVPVAAVALGAEVIEKHFTLDRKMKGPDHKASLEPKELEAMVVAIRNIEKTLGNGIKRPSPSEIKNRAIARKSIVASMDIKKGEAFSEENITTKRPGTGIDPMMWYKVIGKKAKRNFRMDELIEV